jgi:gas vesicle protein
MTDRKDRTRIGIALGIGIIAGSALGLYLNSDKGRKARKIASNKINEFGDKASAIARERADQISKLAQEKAHQFSEGVAHTVESSRKWVDDVSDRIVARMTHVEEEAEELVEETESHIESGMSKARQNIDKKTKDLKGSLN